MTKRRVLILLFFLLNPSVIFAQTSRGKPQNSVASVTKKTSSTDETGYFLRLSNCDDRCRAELNGKAVYGTGFGEDSDSFALAELTQRSRSNKANASRSLLALIDSCMYEEEKCSVNRVGALIRAGADPNAKYEDGQSVLHRALAYQLSLSVIRLLVRAGANVNGKDNLGETVLMTVVQLWNDKAIEYVNILVKAGADVNALRQDGGTALMVAASSGHDPQIVRALLQSGADVSIKNRNGDTALAILEKKIADSKRQGYSFPQDAEMLELLRMANELPQSRREQPSSISNKGEVADVRRVDFLNFTYNPSLCSKDEFGIPKTVRVHNGEYKNKESYFGVAVIYGDVTGDGHDDAIVRGVCGTNASTYGVDEVFIYTLQNGRAALLAQTNGDDMTRDYVRYYPNGGTFTMWWGIRGVKVRNGNVEIEALVDGSHAAPQFIVTLEYRWDNGTFTLSGRPQRRVFSQ